MEARSMESVDGMVNAVLQRMMEEADNEIYNGLVGQLHGRWWWASNLGDNREGSPGEVGFDPDVIYDREDSHGDIIGFYHTHPHSQGCPSQTDYRTMAGWTVSLGRPLLCLIEGIDGLNANWFKDDETPHVRGKIQKIGDIYVGRVPEWPQSEVSSITKSNSVETT